MKNKFGFILIKPQLGENIGACARSMKNFGFNNLNIVSPKFTFPNHKTKVTSVGAIDIINKTRIYNKTIDAVGKFDIVIALSARRRDINKKHISMRDFVNILEKKINLNLDLCLVLRHQVFQMRIYLFQIIYYKFQLQKNLSH